MSSVHKSWFPFFSEQRTRQIQDIEDCIGDNINPEPKNVFRFARMDLNKIKCCILGQDPYPSFPKNGVYIATGRSFEVGTLKSWTDNFAQHSLKNMIRLIYKAYNGELIEYEDIKKKITNGEFNILPPRQWFDNMEDQGVLFLNTYLTCEKGNPNSHREIWKDFNKDLIEYISASNPNITWFLWGGEAQKNEVYIKSGRIYKSNHPRLYDTTSSQAFLNSPCFKDTKDLIDWRGADALTLLRKQLSADTNKAIDELRRIIKTLPPKECYFNNEDDFVTPFTITCHEEMLMQLLLIEKHMRDNDIEKGYTLEELKKHLKEVAAGKDIGKERKRIEEDFLKQAEEGYIRRFVYKK